MWVSPTSINEQITSHDNKTTDFFPKIKPSVPKPGWKMEYLEIHYHEGQLWLAVTDQHKFLLCYVSLNTNNKHNQFYCISKKALAV